MLNLLKQQYPSQLMPQLAEHSQGALDAAAAAFPSSLRVNKTNLQLLVNSVEAGICTYVAIKLGFRPKKMCCWAL